MTCQFSEQSGRGWPRRSFGLIADVDPLAEVRVPLPAGSGAAGATQAADSYEYATATAAPSTGAAAAKGTGTAADRASDTGGTADTGMSAAAADAGVSAAATETGVSAAATETGMGAAAATAAMTAPAAAAAAATCNFNALAERGIFPVEDLKCRQTDVGDFLLGQNKPPGIILRRYIRCGGGCRCGARHRQRHPGCAQCQGCLFRQGCLSALSSGTSSRLRHGRALRVRIWTNGPAAAFACCAMNRQGAALVPLRQMNEGRR
jgi:hypothetical protein